MRQLTLLGISYINVSNSKIMNSIVLGNVKIAG